MGRHRGRRTDLSSWLQKAAQARHFRAAGLTTPADRLALTALNVDLVEEVVDASVGAIDALPEVQFCFVR